MNDVPATSTKDAPRVFADRGVSVPFTTAELLWARVRQKGNTKELLVPGLAKTRGIFVYDWATIRNRFSLSLHDRLLAREIQVGPAPTPDSVTAASLKVAGSGAAGGDAKATTDATSRQSDTLSLHLRFALIKRAIERLGGNAGDFTLDDLANPDWRGKATDALSPVADAYSLTGPALFGRLESLSTLLLPVGLSGVAVEAPSRRLVQRVAGLAHSLSDFAADTKNDAGPEADVMARVAAGIARLAGSAINAIDQTADDIQLLLTEWDERSEFLRTETKRLVWVLDGWERFVKLWQNVADQTPDAQAKALVLMSYVMPSMPAGELPGDERPVWDEMNAELAKIVTAHEEGMDLKTALELLGPDGRRPLSAMAGAVTTKAIVRPSGLAAEKLAQIVRILEPASDRPDGAPARAMLAELRPQLVHLRPPRVRRTCRVVCDVFEELLIDGETTGKIAARIPRSALPPIWALFQERVDPAKLAPLEKGLDQPANVAQLWQLFAATLKHELEEAAAYTSKSRALITRLGGEVHFHAMENIVGAVTIGEHLARLRAALPGSPIQQFSDEDLDKIAAVLNDIRRAQSTQVQTALFVLMSRMAEPWTISAVLERLANTGRFKSSAGIAGFVAIAMLGCLEGQVQDVRHMAEQIPSGSDSPARVGEAIMALADAVDQCAESVAGTNSGLTVSGSPGHIEAAEALRDKVCALLDEKMGGSGAAALVGALTGAPAVRAGTGNTLRPTARWRFDEPLDSAALRNAELYAVALRRCEKQSGVLGLGRKITDGINATVDEFQKVVSVLFSQMRTAGLDRTQREAARGHVAGVAYVIELLAGSEHAERMLSKGLEAVG